MLFSRDRRNRSKDTRRVYAIFELIYTAVDFAAALCFVAGSVMYLFEDWARPGTYLFLVGSILFAAKPTLRMMREIKLAAMGDIDTLAGRNRED